MIGRGEARRPRIAHEYTNESHMLRVFVVSFVDGYLQ